MGETKETNPLMWHAKGKWLFTADASIVLISAHGGAALVADFHNGDIRSLTARAEAAETERDAARADIGGLRTGLENISNATGCNSRCCATCGTAHKTARFILDRAVPLNPPANPEPQPTPERCGNIVFPPNRRGV